MEPIYFEDIELNEKIILGEHFVEKDEMIEFAKKWDPRPLHIDEKAAKTLPGGGVVAPAIYTIGVVNRLSVKTDAVVVMAGIGWDEVRFPNPVFPDDTITVTIEYVDKRDSDSRHDAGIVVSLIEVRNQSNALCLSFKLTFMVAKRPAN